MIPALLLIFSAIAYRIVTGLFAQLFFFRAEDGIRHYKVTGVQTCALPIWPAAAAWTWNRRPARAVRNQSQRRSAAARSEERRVGKEWRCRASPHYLKI